MLVFGHLLHKKTLSVAGYLDFCRVLGGSDLWSSPKARSSFFLRRDWSQVSQEFMTYYRMSVHYHCNLVLGSVWMGVMHKQGVHR